MSIVCLKTREVEAELNHIQQDAEDDDHHHLQVCVCVCVGGGGGGVLSTYNCGLFK